MAVANILTFGGISTATYGLVVEGSGDYSAPKRAVETIEIPGRNGAFQLDKGYYENIEVEYNIVVKDVTQADFRDAIDSYRNAIVSQIGYQRLEDTYHPNEYRMAMYAGGLDEDPAFHGNGAIFKVTFDCKPQRFLTSGETEITVTSGDEITNPTLFDASPLLEVSGYGSLKVGDVEIILSDEAVGDVYVNNAQKASFPANLTLPSVNISNGDEIEFPEGAGASITFAKQLGYGTLTDVSVTAWGGDATASPTVSFASNGTINLHMLFDSQMAFVYGTAATKEINCSLSATLQGQTVSIPNISASISYDGARSMTFDLRTPEKNPFYPITTIVGGNSVVIHSTAYKYGNPTYIDCDFGEAYTYNNGAIVSLNANVALGSKLPVLSASGTEITFDNTITSFKVVPRWWKI